MVSPYLNKKKGVSLSLATGSKKLFQVIYKEQEKKKTEKVDENEAKINVSELISKVAFFYEKVRNYVDYNEEHLYRKNAICRILKRLLVIEGAVVRGNREEIARHLLTELIRAGYLPNDKIPESKIDEVKVLLEKHLRLRELVSPQGFAEQMEKIMQKDKRQLDDWLLNLTASEIEGILEVDKITETVVGNMYEYLVKKIKLPASFSQYESDLSIQIYLSIYRNYLKYDESMLSFILFKYYNAGWFKPTETDIEKIAQNIFTLREMITAQLEHPIVKQLDKIANRYTVFYSILVDMITSDPVALYEAIKNKPETFAGLAKANFKKKFSQAKIRLWRAGLNSIIYIFLTKSVFAVLLEVPATAYLGEPLNYFTLIINILFPPFLLFIVILFTRLSSEANDKKVVAGVEEIAFEEKERKEPLLLRIAVKRSSVYTFIFHFLYSLTFLISFGLVVWVLTKIHFTWVSILIFLFFLVFVAFFSLRIRRGVRQLIVVDERENLVNFVIDFFFIPIAMVGKWLSGKFSKINVFVFILDFIIEAPFKVIVDIAEQWTRYARERREDIE